MPPSSFVPHCLWLPSRDNARVEESCNSDLYDIQRLQSWLSVPTQNSHLTQFLEFASTAFQRLCWFISGAYGGGGHLDSSADVFWLELPHQACAFCEPISPPFTTSFRSHDFSEPFDPWHNLKASHSSSSFTSYFKKSVFKAGPCGNTYPKPVLHLSSSSSPSCQTLKN